MYAQILYILPSVRSFRGKEEGLGEVENPIFFQEKRVFHLPNKHTIP